MYNIYPCKKGKQYYTHITHFFSFRSII